LAKWGKPNSLGALFQQLRTSSVRVIGSGNGFTEIFQSPGREQALARMLRSSPMAIFRLLLGHSPPSLSNSGVVGAKWLRVMAGVASKFMTAGERVRTTD